MRQHKHLDHSEPFYPCLQSIYTCVCFFMCALTGEKSAGRGSQISSLFLLLLSKPSAFKKKKFEEDRNMRGRTIVIKHPPSCGAHLVLLLQLIPESAGVSVARESCLRASANRFGGKNDHMIR